MHRLIFLVVILFSINACQPSQTNNTGPTPYISTVTPGIKIIGVMNTPLPNYMGNAELANPATAAAIANQPTATPNMSQCPAISDIAELSVLPLTGEDISDEIIRYLSAGGSPIVLEKALRDEWLILNESGVIRSDIDLTGDLTPEIIITYTTLTEGGVFFIAGCEQGRYVQRYKSISDETLTPIILLFGDVNHNNINDVVFTNRICQQNEAECRYRTQITEWSPENSTFTSLLGTNIITDTPPEVLDIDNDDVGEIIIRLESNGTRITGPLRTGVNIYDWDGTAYVLSIIQLDAPRFKIQYIHEADRYFVERDMTDAVTLYQLVLNNEDLRTWFADEDLLLESYALYRLLIAYAYSDANADMQTVYQYITNTFPELGEQNPPVYADMSYAFFERYQIVNNLSEACNAVQDIITEQPVALENLNRYGSRNPQYTAIDLCPF